MKEITKIRLFKSICILGCSILISYEFNLSLYGTIGINCGLFALVANRW